jgi:hypothetical protein
MVDEFCENGVILHGKKHPSCTLGCRECGGGSEQPGSVCRRGAFPRVILARHQVPSYSGKFDVNVLPYLMGVEKLKAETAR